MELNKLQKNYINIIFTNYYKGKNGLLEKPEFKPFIKRTFYSSKYLSYPSANRKNTIILPQKYIDLVVSYLYNLPNEKVKKLEKYVLNIYVDDATTDYNGKRNPETLIKVLTEFRHILGGANMFLAVHSLKVIPPSVFTYFSDYAIFKREPVRYIENVYKEDLSGELKDHMNY